MYPKYLLWTFQPHPNLTLYFDFSISVMVSPSHPDSEDQNKIYFSLSYTVPYLNPLSKQTISHQDLLILFAISAPIHWYAMNQILE